jgi:hypothetical protein
MKGTRVLLAVTLVAVWLTPNQAYAQGGWWDWLDAFSGPGPFNNGWQLDARVACKMKNTLAGIDAVGEKTKWASLWTTPKEGYKSGDGFKCLTNATDPGDNSNLVLSYVEVRGGRITSQEKALFSDTPQTELVGTVAAHTLQGFLMRQLHPAFAVGAGTGVLWFSGDNVEGHPWRFVFTPVSVAFMPLKLILPGKYAKQAGLVSIRFEEIAVIGRLTAKKFNNASTSSFETH